MRLHPRYGEKASLYGRRLLCAVLSFSMVFSSAYGDTLMSLGSAANAGGAAQGQEYASEGSSQQGDYAADEQVRGDVTAEDDMDADTGDAYSATDDSTPDADATTAEETSTGTSTTSQTTGADTTENSVASVGAADADTTDATEASEGTETTETHERVTGDLPVYLDVDDSEVAVEQVTVLLQERAVSYDTTTDTWEDHEEYADDAGDAPENDGGWSDVTDENGEAVTADIDIADATSADEVAYTFEDLVVQDTDDEGAYTTRSEYRVLVATVNGSAIAYDSTDDDGTMTYRGMAASDDDKNVTTVYAVKVSHDAGLAFTVERDGTEAARMVKRTISVRTSRSRASSGGAESSESGGGTSDGDGDADPDGPSESSRATESSEAAAEESGNRVTEESSAATTAKDVTTITPQGVTFPKTLQDAVAGILGVNAANDATPSATITYEVLTGETGTITYTFAATEDKDQEGRVFAGVLIGDATEPTTSYKTTEAASSGSLSVTPVYAVTVTDPDTSETITTYESYQGPITVTASASTSESESAPVLMGGSDRATQTIAYANGSYGSASFVYQVPNNSITLTKMWEDNLASEKPFGPEDVGNFHLEYSTDGGNTWSDVSDSLDAFGYGETPAFPETTDPASNDSVWLYTFYNELLPYVLEDGTPTAAIYRLAEKQAVFSATLEDGTTVEYYASYTDTDNATLVNTKLNPYTATKAWADNDNKYHTRPTVKQWLDNITIQRTDDGGVNWYDVSLSTTDKNALGYIKVTENPDGTWTIDLPNALGYNLEDAPYNYRIVEKDMPTSTTDEANTHANDGTVYTPTYNNVGNYSSITNGLLSGGTATNTLTNTTTFEGNKTWLDDGSEETIADRPTATLALLRYPDDGTSNYTNASPVVGYTSTELSNEADSAISIGDNTLPMFDEEGQEYVYYVKETLSDESYVQVPTNTETIAKTVAGADKFLFDGGTLYNRKTDTQDYTVTKSWVAGARQHMNAEVTVGLVANKASDSTSELSDEQFHNAYDVSSTMDGFTSENQSLTVEFEVSSYDDKGYPITYTASEDSISTEVDGNMQPATVITENGTTYIITADGYRYKQTMTQDEEGNYTITNQLVGDEQVTVNKTFGDGLLVDAGETVSITYTVYQGETVIGTITKDYTATEANSESSYSESFTITSYDQLKGAVGTGNLPRYDAYGNEYVYTARETKITTTDSSGVSYVKYVTNDEASSGTYETATAGTSVNEVYGITTVSARNMKPGEPGINYSVYKEWMDDDDESKESNITFELQYYYVADGATDGEWVTVDKGTILKGTNESRYRGLNRTVGPNGSITGKEMDEDFKESEDDGVTAITVNGEKRVYTDKDNNGFPDGSWADLYQTWRAGSAHSSDAAEGNFRLVETTVDGIAVQEDSSELQTSHPEHHSGYSFVSTENQNYDVSPTAAYGQEHGGDTYDFTLTNTRVGTLQFDIDKFWYDGEDGNEIRPESIDITVTASLNVWDDDGKVVDLLNSDASATAAEKTYTMTVNNVVEDTDGKQWHYITENLPKYDAEGRVITYTLAELSVNLSEENQAYGYYTSQVSDPDYRVGTHSTGDVDYYDYSNTLTGSIQPYMNKYWKDLGDLADQDINNISTLTEAEKTAYKEEAKEVRNSRPDIYPVLYRASTNPKNLDGDGSLIYEEQSYVDRDWESERLGDSWLQCRFTELPRYDEEGYEYKYAIGEAWGNSTHGGYELAGAFDGEPETLKYLASEGGTMPASQYSYNSTTANTITVKNTDGTYSQVSASVYSAATSTQKASATTLVNRPKEDRTISGVKVWNNLPAGFSRDQLPDVTFQLWKCGLYADDDNDNVTYGYNTETAGAVMIGEWTKAELEATMASGSDTFSFTEAVPRYDEDGLPIIYFVKEVDPTNLQYAFEVQNSLDTGLTVTNSYYADQNLTVSFTKTWEDYPSDETPPTTTFTLVRALTDSSGNVIPNTYETVFATAKDGEDENNTNNNSVSVTAPSSDGKTAGDSKGTVTFSTDPTTGVSTGTINWTHLAYVSPNGYNYAYFLREESVNGWTVYSVDNSGDEAQLTKVDSYYEGGTNYSTYQLSNKDGGTSGEMVNKYGVTGRLKVSKTWDTADYDVAALPDELELRLSKKANEKDGTLDVDEAIAGNSELSSAGDGATYTNVTLKKSDATVTTDEDAGTVTWTVILEDLQVYAPNGDQYTYSIAEDEDDVPDGFELSSISDGVQIEEAVTEDGTTTPADDALAELKVANKQDTTSLSTTKTWTDYPIDEYGNQLTDGDLLFLSSMSAIAKSITYRVAYSTYDEDTGTWSAWSRLDDGDKQPVTLDVTQDDNGTLSKPELTDLPTYITVNGVQQKVRYMAYEYSLAYDNGTKYTLTESTDPTAETPDPGKSFAGAKAEADDKDGTAWTVISEFDRISDSGTGTTKVAIFSTTTTTFSEEGTTETVSNQSDISNSVPLKELTITKVWEDQDNRDGLRADELTFTVTRTGIDTSTDTATATTTLTADNVKKTTDADGNVTTDDNVWTKKVYVPYYWNTDNTQCSQYAIEETTLPDDEYTVRTAAATEVGLTAEGTDSVAPGVTAWIALETTVDDTGKVTQDQTEAYFLNKQDTNQKVHLSVPKTWVHDGDEYDAVTNTDLGTKFTALPSWMEAWLPAQILYTLQYSTDGQSWTAVKGSEGVDSDFYNVGAPITKTVSHDESTLGAVELATWENLPRYESDSVVYDEPIDYIYRVVETMTYADGSTSTSIKSFSDAYDPESIDAGESTYKPTVTSVNNTAVITYQTASINAVNTLLTDTASATKTWAGDSDNAYGTRPDAITYEVQQSTDGSTWAAMSHDILGSATITADDTGEVTATLAASGATVTVASSDKSDYGFEVTGLPRYDASGTELQYRIVEVALMYGSTSVTPSTTAAYASEQGTTTSSDNTFTTPTTNTLNTTRLTVNKTFEDEHGLFEDIDSVTYKLQRRIAGGTWADVTTSDGATATATTGAPTGDNGSCSATFAQLPAYDENGNLYEYRAVETGYTVDGTFVSATAASTSDPTSGTVGAYGYTSSTSYDSMATATNSDKTTDTGLYTTTSTNTLNTGKLAATKVWADENDRDDVRPESITLHLVRTNADGSTTVMGEAYDKTLTSESASSDGANTWYGVLWGALPTTDAYGKAVTYSVTEADILDSSGYARYEATYGTAVAPSDSDAKTTATATVTNTLRPNLALSKTVTVGDHAMNMDAYKNQVNKEFTFTVTLTGADGKAASGTFGGTITTTLSNSTTTTEATTVTFGSDGTATVTLKHGQTLQLNGLPVGSSYTIAESSENGYTQTAPVDASGAAVNATGTLAASTTTAVAYSNDYDASTVTTATVVKNLANRNFIASDEFTYTITAVDTDADGKTIAKGPLRMAKDGENRDSIEVTFSNKEGADSNLSTSTNTASVAGPLYFDLEDLWDESVDTYVTKSFRYKVVENIPEGATSNGDGTYTLKGVTYDSTAHYVTYWLTDGGDGTLKIAKSYEDEPGSTLVSAVSSTNTYAATGTVSLRGTKLVDGRDWLDGETHTLVLTGADGATPMPSGDGATTTEAATKSAPTVTFDTITYDIDDLIGSGESVASTKTFTYYVTEKIPDDATATAADGTSVTYGKADEVQKASLTFSKDGVTYDDAKHEVRVTVSDNGDGTLTATPIYTDDSETAAVVTNTYEASGTAQVQAVKRLAGKALTANEFGFTLTPGTYTDASGAVKTSPLRTSDHGTAVTSVTASNAAPETTGGTGTATFADLYFTEEDAGTTFPYVLTENVPDGATDNGDGTYTKDGVTYAKESYTVFVAVVDDGDGTLTTTVTYGESGATEGSSTTAPKFTNAYDASGTSNVGITKIISAREWTRSVGFFFTLTPRVGAPMPTVDVDGQTYDVTAMKITEDGLVYQYVADGETKSATVTEGWHIDIDHQTREDAFTLDYALSDLDVDETTGLPKETTFEYLLVEDPYKDATQMQDGRFQWNDLYYDTTPRTVRVAVSDDGSGGLNTVVTVDDKATSTATFTNTYEVNGRVGIDVKKTVHEQGDTNLNWDEHVWSEGDSYTLTITKDKDWYPSIVTDTSGGIATDDSTLEEHNTLSITTTKDVQTAAFNVQVDEDDFVKRDENGNALDDDGNVTTNPDEYVYLDKADFYYTVTETGGSGKGVTVSSDSVKVKVSATREIVDPKTEETELALTVYYSTDGGETWNEPTSELPITIYNEYAATGEATVDVTKAITGRAWQEGESFSFTLEPLAYAKDSDGNDVMSPLHETKTAGAGEATTYSDVDSLSAAINSTTENHAAAFSLPYTIADLQGKDSQTFYYKVSEVAGDTDGLSYDTRTYTVAVKVTDAGDGTLTTSVEQYECSDGSKPSAAAFTNTYDASGTASLAWNKELVGRTWQETDAYEIVVTPGTYKDSKGNDTVSPLRNASGITQHSLVAVASKASKDEGLWQPFALPFTLADLNVDENGLPVATTFSYVVTETKGDLGGITYDSASYTVNVTVSDAGDGTLQAEVAYTTADESADTAVFTNTYTATGATQLSAAKTFEDYDWPNGDTVQFQVEAVTKGAPMPKDATGAENATATATSGSRQALFNAITFTRSDSDASDTATASDAWSADYIYKICEVVPDDAVNADGVAYAGASDEQKTAGGFVKNGTTFSNDAYYAKVHVTDDGNGKLYAVPTYFADAECTEDLGDEDTSYSYTYAASAVESETRHVPMFTNVYDASLEVAVSVSKTLAGIDEYPKGLEFTYHIDAGYYVDEDGNETTKRAPLYSVDGEDTPVEMLPATITKDIYYSQGAIATFGYVKFKIKDLNQNEDGSYAPTTFTYYVYEVVPEDAKDGMADGYIYDTSYYKITATFWDEGTGTLKSTIAWEKVDGSETTKGQSLKAMPFTNEVATSLTVVKEWGEDDPASIADDVASTTYQLQRRTAVTGKDGTTAYGAWENVDWGSGSGRDDASVTVANKSGDGGNTYTWTSLPRYIVTGDATSGEYEYRAVETGITLTNDAAKKLGRGDAFVAVSLGDDATGGTVGGFDYTSKTDKTVRSEAESGTVSYATTVTNTPILGPFSATKTWVDDNDRENLRPESVAFTLMKQESADKEPVVASEFMAGESGEAKETAATQTVTFAKGDDKSAKAEWGTATWDNLPVCDVAGNRIAYSVAENEVDGYTAQASEETLTAGATTKTAVTNIHAITTQTVQAYKEWKGDTVDSRAKSIELTLYATYKDAEGNAVKEKAKNEAGEDVATVTLTADSTATVDGEERAWAYEWEGMPAYKTGFVDSQITYTVEETPVPGYTTAYGETGLVVVNTQVETSLTATKSWPNDAYLGGQVASVTLRLQRSTDGTAWDDVDVGGTKTVEKNGSEGVTATWTGLPVTNKNGNAYRYRAVETSITLNDEDGTVLPVSATDDGAAQTGTVGGYGYSSKTTAAGKVSDAEGAEAKDSAGKTYNTYATAVTNAPILGSFSATKKWDDDNDRENLRPRSVEFTLMKQEGADEKPEAASAFTTATQTVTFAEGDDKSSKSEWGTATWDNLPVYDVAGNKIEYSVVEGAVENYTTAYEDAKTIEGSVGGKPVAMVVTNTHTRQTVSVTAQKMWEGDENWTSDRPAAVTLTLKATYTYKDANGKEVTKTEDVTADELGKKIEPVTLRENADEGVKADGTDASGVLATGNIGNWTYQWTNLPEYKTGLVGAKITYTVEETPVNGYSVSYDETGRIVTNTMTESSLTANKSWPHDDLGIGEAVTGIMLQLQRSNDGGETWTDVGDPVNVTKGEDTTSWGSLPTYDANGNEYEYRTVEVGITVGEAGSEDLLTVYVDGAEEARTEAGTVGGYNYSATTEARYDDAAAVYRWHTSIVNDPQAGAIVVEKHWDDADDKDGVRPDALTVGLSAIVDGKAYELGKDVETSTVLSASETEDADWRDATTWASLPIKDAAGNDITYTVTESVSEDAGATVSAAASEKFEDAGYSAEVAEGDGAAREGLSGSTVLAEDESYTAEFTITNTHSPHGDYSFTKEGYDSDADLTHHSALEGVTYGVFTDEAAQSPLTDAGGAALTFTSDAAGTVTLADLPVGTWYVRETAAPATYHIDTTVWKVTVAADGTIDTENTTLPAVVVDEEVRASFTFTKVSARNRSLRLAGSRYGLFRVVAADGTDTGESAQTTVLVGDDGRAMTVESEPIQTAVTDENGQVTINNLRVGSIYVVRELEAPAGYQVSEDDVIIKVVQSADDANESAWVTLLDASGKELDTSDGGVVTTDDDGNPIWLEPSTEVAVEKVDPDGALLAGASLAVTDEDGNEVDAWTSEEAAHVMEAELVAGETYTLTETSAPEGYLVADPVTFTVDEVKLAVGKEYTQTVTMEDPVDTSSGSGGSGGSSSGSSGSSGSSNTATTSTKSSSVPTTGDATALWYLVPAAGGSGLVLLGRRGRRKRR